ncbi:MAG TPA: GNAT family N-acetyltransferase [Burkholderiaceae bacterium]
MTEAPHPTPAIRRAQPAEATQLEELARAAKAAWPYSARQMDAWRHLIVVPAADVAAHPTFVATFAEAIAGFYMLKREPVWALHDLWVAPAHMRRGVGSALFDHAQATALAHGATIIAIDAEPYAEPFYLAHGAIRVGAIAAPSMDDPHRVRPQLTLALGPQ